MLDAAIQVLGTRGMRQLTHRAVDEQAGVPPGSTSNHFRTREALLSGVLDRILEQEIAGWNRVAETMAPDETVPRDKTVLRDKTVPLDEDRFVAVLGSLVDHLSSRDRVLTLARLAVFAEAATNPALQRRIGEAQRRLLTWAAPLAAGLGLREPRQLKALLALIDGLLVNQFANPDPEFDAVPAISALLSGLR